MIKQKSLKISHRLISIILVAVFTATVTMVPFARADQFDQQINQLKAENAQKQNQVQTLKVEASSLQETIAGLQVQIDGLLAQIAANRAKNNELQRQITEAEIELAKQKKLLGENIKAMYLEGDISTIEMLASSKDLSD